MTQVREHYRRSSRGRLYRVRKHDRRSPGDVGAGAVVVILLLIYGYAKSHGLAP